MKIRLIWVGKTKEQFIREGIAKYSAALKRYAEVSLTEVKEEKSKDPRVTIEKESERIEALPAPYILLDEKGRRFTSPEFARFVEAARPNMAFVLGGAFGVSQKVKDRASHVISLSPLTFTHEMARLILLEQLYRAFSIIENRGYHH